MKWVLGCFTIGLICTMGFSDHQTDRNRDGHRFSSTCDSTYCSVLADDSMSPLESHVRGRAKQVGEKHSWSATSRARCTDSYFYGNWYLGAHVPHMPEGTIWELPEDPPGTFQGQFRQGLRVTGEVNETKDASQSIDWCRLWGSIAGSPQSNSGKHTHWSDAESPWWEED